MNQHEGRTQKPLSPAVITALAGLGVIAIVAVVIVVGGLVLRGSGQPAPQAVPLTPSLTAAPAQAEVTPSPVLAPTIAPTPVRIEHIVQQGQTPSSVAVLYNIDLPALLAENNLTAETFIQPGQRLSIPLPPGAQPTVHTVAEGESLALISQRYNVTLPALQSANNLADVDNVIVGQQLRIPGIYLLPDAPAPTPTTEPALAQPGATPRPAEIAAAGIPQAQWPRSVLEGDLAANYPLQRAEPRFTLHYQPGTYAEANLDALAALATQAMENVERALNVRYEGPLDLYIAGTLFEAPNAHLRGLSRSVDRRVFLLYDGSGDPAEREYLFTHELTHVISWNMWGAPSSTMLSEGLATYAGRTVLERGGYLPYDALCAGISQAGQLPSMAAIERDWQSFRGHIRDWFNYFGAGCFVDYLVQEYGLDAMSRLYNSADYTGLYGSSLASLDADWRATLQSAPANTPNPEDLARYTLAVNQAYAYVFGSYDGSATLHSAYAAVDQARLALWRGDFEECQRWLAEFTSLIGFDPSAG